MRARLLFFAIFIFSVTSHAQFMAGPIASGSGGAGRASIDPGEISFLNPAGVAHLQRYYASAGYASAEHPRDGNLTRYNVLLADGTLGISMPGAFSYVRRNIDKPGFSSTEQDIALTLAGFSLNKLAMGVTAHRLMSSTGGRDDNQDNATVGFIFNPKMWLGLAFVAYDILPTSDSVPLAVREIPTFAVGAHVLFNEIFSVRCDVIRPDIQRGYDGRRNDVAVGLESFFRRDLAVQLGAQFRETADQTLMTTGFGYHGPKLSFDYSFQKDVRSATGTRHVVDLWMPL